MAASVKWATASDFDEFGKERPYRSLALTGRNEDGKIIGIGGIAFLADGQKYAFTELTDEARAHPVALHKAGKMILNLAEKRGIRRLIAAADMSASPAAERWLKRLGFQAQEINNRTVWIWRP